MAGREFLQIPGPTNIPERVLRAMDRAAIDHRGPDLPAVTLEVIDRLCDVFATGAGRIAVWAGSGSGAWEAAVVNTIEAGERVLAFDNGLFGKRFGELARTFGAEVETVEMRWGEAITPELVAGRLGSHTAVLVVHNETSTGVTSDLGAIRRAIDSTGRDPLLLVDAISSLGAIEFRFDEWGVDVAVAASQKGLMMAPGLGICCISPRALERSERVTNPRGFYDWRRLLETLADGYYPNTPPTLELFGLREALRMLDEEGLDNVYARHHRLAEGVRRAVEAWDLGFVGVDRERLSDSLTAVLSDHADAEAMRDVARTRLHLSLGGGLGPLRERSFRIGHMGSLNELEVIATLGGIELALTWTGHPVELGSGVGAAERWFRDAD